MLKTKQKRMLSYLLLSFILIYTAAYSILFAIGPSHMGDDIAYSFLSHYWVQGTFVENSGNILSIRLLQIIPIGISYALFGYGILSSAAWDIVCFELSVLLAFLIGREIYDEYVGVLAAFLLAIFPMTAIYSTTMSDNIPMMFFVGLSFFALIKALRNDSRVWYFVSGAALFSSALVTPEGFIMWIVIGLLLAVGIVMRRLHVAGKEVKISISKTTMYIAVGFALVFAVTLVFNYINSANPLITFSSNAQYYSQTWRPDLIPYPLSVALSFYPNLMFPYNIVNSIGGLANSNFDLASIITNGYANGANTVGFFFYAFIPAALLLLVRRDKRAYILLFWFVAGFLYLEFGPQYASINPLTYVLSHRLDRYLTLIALPMVVIISAALLAFVRESKGIWVNAKLAVFCLIVLFLTVTSLMVTVYDHSIAQAEQAPQYQVSQYILSLPNTTNIYLDSGAGDILVYTKFDNLNRFNFDYGGFTKCYQIPRGSYVLVYDYQDVFNYTNGAQLDCPWWKEAFVPDISGFNSTIEGLAQNWQTTLYYVSANNQTPNSVHSIT